MSDDTIRGELVAAMNPESQTKAAPTEKWEELTWEERNRRLDERDAREWRESQERDKQDKPEIYEFWNMVERVAPNLANLSGAKFLNWMVEQVKHEAKKGKNYFGDFFPETEEDLVREIGNRARDSEIRLAEKHRKKESEASGLKLVDALERLERIRGKH